MSDAQRMLDDPALNLKDEATRGVLHDALLDASREFEASLLGEQIPGLLHALDGKLLSLMVEFDKCYANFDRIIRAARGGMSDLQWRHFSNVQRQAALALDAAAEGDWEDAYGIMESIDEDDWQPFRKLLLRLWGKYAPGVSSPREHVGGDDHGTD